MILQLEGKYLEEVRQNKKPKEIYPLAFFDSLLDSLRNRKYEIISKSGTKIECKVIINSVWVIPIRLESLGNCSDHVPARCQAWGIDKKNI